MNPFSGTFLIRSRPEILVAADIPAETGMSHGRIGCKAEGKLAGLCTAVPKAWHRPKNDGGMASLRKLKNTKKRRPIAGKEFTGGDGSFFAVSGKEAAGPFFAGQTIKRGNRA
ncbi:hypothetical protein Cdeb_00521 [Caldibacillus debilis GB1]|jgi:hypothetical protein|uniref:Uncharacterized protein n=1 Tax=Caldibacillus debilis GB1 TaxID=1339248 RepID=A0A420VGG9_9BACI|nr:hypothetical protein Cdeb_00521 [Caldibacillus debilis GB1]